MMDKEKMIDIDSRVYEELDCKIFYICIEELAELQQALTKMLRGKINLENLEEEIADVEICLEWIKEFSPASLMQIEKWKEFKYNRMDSRLKNGEFK